MTETTVSKRTYFIVYVALMLLLGLTFAMAYVDLGPFNTTVSLLIAAIKGLLVALFFMHIRYTNGIHRVVAIAGLFWLGILLVLSLSDYVSRDWLPLPSGWPPRPQLPAPNR